MHLRREPGLQEQALPPIQPENSKTKGEQIVFLSKLSTSSRTVSSFLWLLCLLCLLPASHDQPSFGNPLPRARFTPPSHQTLNGAREYNKIDAVASYVLCYVYIRRPDQNKHQSRPRWQLRTPERNPCLKRGVGTLPARK